MLIFEMFENARPPGDEDAVEDDPGRVPRLGDYALKQVPGYSMRAKETLKFNRSFNKLGHDLERIDSAYFRVPCDMWLLKRMHPYVPVTHVGVLKNKRVLSEEQLNDFRNDPNPIPPHHNENVEEYYSPTVIASPYWRCRSLEIKFSYLSLNQDYFVITCRDDPFHISHPFYDFRNNLKSNEEYAVPDPVIHVQIKIFFSDLERLRKSGGRGDPGIKSVAVPMVQNGFGRPMTTANKKGPWVRKMRNAKTKAGEEGGERSWMADAKEFAEEDHVHWDALVDNVLLKKDDSVDKYLGYRNTDLKLFKDYDKSDEENTHYFLRYDLIPFFRKDILPNDAEKEAIKQKKGTKKPPRDTWLNLFTIPFDLSRLKAWKNHVTSAREARDGTYNDLFPLLKVPIAFFDNPVVDLLQELGPIPTVYAAATDEERADAMNLLKTLWKQNTWSCEGDHWSFSKRAQDIREKYGNGILKRVTDEQLQMECRPIMIAKNARFCFAGHGTNFSNRHVKRGEEGYVYFQIGDDPFYKNGPDFRRRYYRTRYEDARSGGVFDERRRWKYRTYFTSECTQYMENTSPNVSLEQGVDLTVAVHYEDMQAYLKFRKTERGTRGGVIANPPTIRTKVWGAVCGSTFLLRDRESDANLWNTSYAYADGSKNDFYVQSESFHATPDLIFPFYDFGRDPNDQHDDVIDLWNANGDLNLVAMKFRFRKIPQDDEEEEGSWFLLGWIQDRIETCMHALDRYDALTAKIHKRTNKAYEAQEKEREKQEKERLERKPSGESVREGGKARKNEPRERDVKRKERSEIRQDERKAATESDVDTTVEMEEEDDDEDMYYDDGKEEDSDEDPFKIGRRLYENDECASVDGELIGSLGLSGKKKRKTLFLMDPDTPDENIVIKCAKFFTMVSTRWRPRPGKKPRIYSDKHTAWRGGTLRVNVSLGSGRSAPSTDPRKMILECLINPTSITSGPRETSPKNMYPLWKKAFLEPDLPLRSPENRKLEKLASNRNFTFLEESTVVFNAYLGEDSSSEMMDKFDKTSICINSEYDFKKYGKNNLSTFTFRSIANTYAYYPAEYPDIDESKSYVNEHYLMKWPSDALRRIRDSENKPEYLVFARNSREVGKKPMILLIFQLDTGPSGTFYCFRSLVHWIQDPVGVNVASFARTK